MKLTSQKKFVIPAAVCIAVILFLCYYYFFTPMLAGDSSRYVYIDDDDNIDSVYVKLREHTHRAIRDRTGQQRVHRVQEAKERPSGIGEPHRAERAHG